MLGVIIWNDEDLSIFSRDQQEDPNDINSGGRALRAVLRPYPLATSGNPLYLSFSYENKRFMYQFLNNPEVSSPTVIYVPNYHYLEGYNVEVSGGKFEADKENQLLVIHSTSKIQKIKITITPIISN